MEFRDILSFSFSSALRGRSRALLTALAVAIGICSVMLITALGNSGEAVVAQQLDSLGISGLTIYPTDDSSPSLCADDAAALEREIKDVENATPLVLEYGSFQLKGERAATVLWGVDSSLRSVIDINLLYGRLPNQSDILSKRNCVVVDSELAQQYYHRKNIVGKTLYLTVAEKTEQFEIIGVIQPQKEFLNQLVGGLIPAFLYLPYTKLNEMRALDEVSQIAVRCFASSNIERSESQITSFLNRRKNGNAEYSVENMSGYVDNLKSIASLVALLIGAIAAISLCVAGLGIMNAMLASTAERKKEIGICMALGAKRSDIALCFMTESAIISGVGGICGALSGYLISWLLTSAFDMPTIFDLPTFLIVITISILCGIIFSVLPAIRASKLDPIKALREDS